MATMRIPLLDSDCIFVDRQDEAAGKNYSNVFNTHLRSTEGTGQGGHQIDS